MQRQTVLDVAGQLQQDHAQLMDILSNSNNAVNTTLQNWFGADASNYGQQWTGNAKQFQAAADMVQAMSKQATEQAGQQESTSNA
jgi:hypothetical protein